MDVKSLIRTRLMQNNVVLEAVSKCMVSMATLTDSRMGVCITYMSAYIYHSLLDLIPIQNLDLDL